MKSRNNKTNCKKLVALCLLFAMLVTSIGAFGTLTEVQAAKKQKATLKFKKSTITLQQGKKATVKMKKTKIKKVKIKKWSIKNKKIAKVTKKGVVTGLRVGKTQLTCKVKYLAKGTKKYKNKTLKCKIKVTAPASANGSDSSSGTNGGNSSTNAGNTSAPDASTNPGNTQTPDVSTAPDNTENPDGTTAPDQTTAPDNTQKPDQTTAPGSTENPDVTTSPDQTQEPENTKAPAGTENPDVTTAPDQTQEPENTKAPNQTQKPDSTAAPDSTSTPLPTNAPAPGFGLTPLEFAAQLGAGINIGNSLESNSTMEYLEENGYQGSPMKDLYLSGDAGLALETSWGNSEKISKAFIQGIKAAGFKTIRLPVSYVNHVKTELVDGKKVYTIDEQWLNRVQEVVDWALEEDLYIIINLHHDGSDNCDENGNLNVFGGEQASWLSPVNHSGDAYAQMEAKFISLWTQIATKFKSYSDHLLFADMNEFHHGYNDPQTEWCNAQNKLHQAFVDTIRSTGDNNIGRYLIIPGYNTNIDYSIQHLVLPTDCKENQTTVNGNTVGHLIVEVHYYDPYTYAADDPTDTLWGSDAGEGAASWGHEDFLEGQMQKMKTNYIAKGIPVVIGEFGAPEHKIDKEIDRKYRTYYYSCVVKSAVQNGLVPIAWDNGTSYQLLARDGSVTEQTIVDAIMKYSSNPSAEIVKPTAN